MVMKGRISAKDFPLTLVQVAASVSTRLVIVVGLTVLIGWLLFPALLISKAPYLAQISPNTAVGCILVGFSARFWRLELINHRAATVAKTFRISAGVLGLVTLLQYLFGRDVGIDRFIFDDPTGLMSGHRSLTMTPAVALCFYFLSCALVLLSARRGYWICQGLTIASVLVALGSTVAHLFALPLPPTSSLYPLMPAPTAVLLLALGLSVLFSNTHRTVMLVVTSGTAGGRTARRLLPASIVIPVGLAWLRLAGEHAGLFTPQMGLILHVLATISLLCLFTLWNAYDLDRLSKKNDAVEAALQEREFQLQEIFDKASNIIYIHDLQENLTFLNQAAERRLGYDRKHAASIGLSDIIAPESMDLVRRMLALRLTGGTATFHEQTMFTKAKERVCLEAEIVALTRNGDPRTFVVVAKEKSESVANLRAPAASRKSAGTEAQPDILRGLAFPLTPSPSWPSPENGGTASTRRLPEK